MDQSTQYGQMDFNLPHDVVKLPSKGLFYKPKKESLKVGYLTASDENLLMSPSIVTDGIINTLLRKKIYEPGFDINQLLDVDAKVILIFLRNTSFGPEYKLNVEDPKTGKQFEASIMLDRMSIIQSKEKPNDDGTFTLTLPFSKNTVKVKFLSLYDTIEIDRILDSYPSGRVTPTVTTRLNRMVVELNGSPDRNDISTFCENMPIGDSKHIRNFLRDNEPRLDLKKEIVAPSGEKVTVSLAFGVEFFRPFF
jgi:hypothetical protein